MIADYRFLRTLNHVTYYAHVWVQAEPAPSDIEVVNGIGPSVAEEDGEFSSETAPAWVEAALEGIRAAAAELIRIGCVPNGLNVKLCRLVGSVLDTREDVVACAAAVATWKAGCPELTPPEIVFSDDRWTVRSSAG